MDRLSPVPTTIHGYPVVAHRPASPRENEISAIVLVRREDDYVTWSFNRQSPGTPDHPGAHYGHYDMTLDEAAEDFATRQDHPTLAYTCTSHATRTERDAVRCATIAAF